MQQNHSNPVDPNDPVSVFAYAYTSAVGVAMLLFGPLVIGAYIEIVGISETQAGYLFSIEMAGYALSSVIVFFILPHINWRHILFVGVVIIISANIISILLYGYTALLKTRFLAGIGAGLLMNMTIVSIGLTRNVDRNYGFWTMAQLMVGASGLFMLPALITRFGLFAPFAMISVLALFILPLVHRYPTEAKISSGTGNSLNILFLGLSGLIGIFIYYSGQAAVWAYIERIGISVDIPPATVGTILSISLLTAIVSATSATWLADRYGRRLPITVSMICSAVAIVSLWHGDSIIIYTMAACMFNAAWYFCLPYITAVIANIDTNGRLLVGLAVVFPTSLAAGPVLAASLLSGEGYSPVLCIGVLSLPLGLAIMWNAAGKNNI